jgi:hypothetical protein
MWIAGCELGIGQNAVEVEKESGFSAPLGPMALPIATDVEIQAWRAAVPSW